ncbi:hypothetical protein M9H77_31636 [Catharanthus roseus]|uniref:Uncharacterized protein n=1 Tax=Catharanthus roseus TaxID=4058 RepID=A0ACC0A2Q6_CATRO|nr:hypothetical protein M9H77_31636 [Catharanthus roseus]
MQKQVRIIQDRLRTAKIHRTWASSDDVDGFLTLRVHPLEEGHSTLRACPIGIYVDIASCSMPELGSDDLVMGSGLCLWSPTVALHVLLNLGVEAVLMCFDSLRLPSCARNPYAGRSEIQ